MCGDGTSTRPRSEAPQPAGCAPKRPTDKILPIFARRDLRRWKRIYSQFFPHPRKTYKTPKSSTALA